MEADLREIDLEAGPRTGTLSAERQNINHINGTTGYNGIHGGRIADEMRPLLQTSFGNQEDQLIQLGMKPVKEKHKKINSKRTPKPPRPPKGPSMDAADLKFIRELSEFALEKRMRIERVKDLKKIRAAKAASSSSSNSTLVALIITVLFCLIILFQGVCSRSSSVLSLQYSPGPVLSPGGDDLISIQIFKNPATGFDDNGPSSEAPKSYMSVEGSSPRDAG